MSIRDSLKEAGDGETMERAAPRSVDVDGTEWTVSSTGSGRSRTGGAPLIEVGFEGPASFTAVIVGSALDRIDDRVLVDQIRRFLGSE